MKQLRNFVLFGLLGLFLFSACKGESSILADATLESALPKDSSLVFVVDYSNGDQVDAFRDLKDRFPETDLSEKFQALVFDPEETKINYKDDIEPFLDGKWRVGMTMVFPEDINFENFEAEGFGDFENFEIYIAAEFEESDAFEDFLNLTIEESDEKKFDYEEDGEIKYWSNDEDLVYFVRYNDVFVLTNNPDSREDAVDRMAEGSGFNTNIETTQAVSALAPENLGYFYMDFSVLAGFLTNLYASMGMTDFGKYFEGMDDVYAVWFADDDGIMIVSQNKVIDPAFYEEFFGDGSYGLSLKDYVNGDGLIAFSESANFGSYLQNFIQGFAAGYNSVDSGFDPGTLETNVAGSQDNFDTDPNGGVDSYQELLDELSSLGDVSSEDLGEILNSPFAFAMSDVGGYIPTLAFYVQVDEAQAENAKQLTVALDEYMDKIIVEFDNLMQQYGGTDVGLIKKDLEVVSGGGLHKLYVDWAAASPETLSTLALAGLSSDDLKIELYYGITGNNVFLIALYPDFQNSYGENAVSERDDFKEGFEKVGGSETFYISYFSFRPLIDIAGRYLEIVRNYGFILDEDMRNFDLYGRQFAGTLKYFVSSTVYSEEDMMSKTYVRFEEVEE